LTPDPGAVAPDAKSPDGAAAAVTAQIELTRSQPSDATAPADAGAASNASGGASDPTAAVALARRLANGTQRADSKIPGEADPTSGQTTDTTGDATGSDKNANFAASLLASVAPTAGNSAQAGALEAAGSRPIEASAPPAGGAAAALPETTGASVTGAFGPAPTYAAEVRASVATPIGHPAFGQDLSQQVVLLTRRGVQSAQISLDPAGLGPVSVSIQVHGHAASLAFTAAHEATRHALEAALPRLREMFASSGMQLSDATVGGRSQQEWTASGRPQTSSWANPEASLAPSSDAAATPRGAAVRLVDTYA
jgi:flagellar hook-length control protein FliK